MKRVILQIRKNKFEKEKQNTHKTVTTKPQSAYRVL